MPLPQTPNTTCDIYRSTSPPPPAAPDVAAVPCVLLPDFAGCHRAMGEGGGASGNELRWTHVLLVDVSVDIRDAYTGADDVGTTLDHVYVPDKDGTKFDVIFVERLGYTGDSDHKRAYLRRDTVSWPTNYL